MTFPSPSVHVTHLDRNGTWLVALEGEHDIATRPLLEQRMGDIWPRCTLAVIDLSAATFIDCSVVAWLVRSRDALGSDASGGSAFRIVEGRPAGAVLRVIEVLELREAFDWYATREAAIAERSGASGSRDPRATSSTSRGSTRIRRPVEEAARQAKP